MGELHELRLRHNRFTDNLDVYIEEVIDDNQALLDLNRKQLKEEHKTSKGRPIAPKYSKAYAAFKGFSTPDLFLTGETHRTLQIEAKGEKYRIFGTTEQVPQLIEKYGEDIFGIPTDQQAVARQITTDALGQIYVKIVYKR